MVRVFFSLMKLNLMKLVFSQKWRKKNKHNQTCAMNIFPMEKVNVGEGTYGELRVLTYHCDDEQLQIGNYCSIANDVLFVLGGEHDYRCLSNYPFMRKYYKTGIDAVCKGPIIVEDDVWIGARCTILSGVTLGKGSVIGAGSVVACDVPAYSIFVGGKVAKYRFSPDIIEKVSKLDFNKLQDRDMSRYKDYCHERITNENIDMIIDAFSGK